MHLIATLLSLPLLLVSGSLRAQQGSLRLKEMEWLEGTWRSENFEAVYSAPTADVILGMSKDHAWDSLRFFEFERFEVITDTVVLTPYPSGKESVAFKLVDPRPHSTRAHFQNLKHDFPTDITYELLGDGNLRITVEGKRKGKKDEWVLNLERVGFPVIREEVIIPTTRDSVWWAITTSEGIKSFFAKGGANIDLRPGGLFEIWMNPEGPAGRRGMDSMTVLAMNPAERLSLSWRTPQFRVYQNEPSYLDIRLNSLSPRTTRVRMEQSGWAEGREGEAAYRAQKNLLRVFADFLKRRFTMGPIDWEKPFPPPEGMPGPRRGSQAPPPVPPGMPPPGVLPPGVPPPLPGANPQR